MKMQTVEQIFENGIEQWRLSKGIGTALIPNTVDDRYFVLGLLQRIYARNPTNNVLIVADTFTERAKLLEFITHQENEENNEEFKKCIDNHSLKIWTFDYAITHTTFFSNLTIAYHVSKMDIELEKILVKARFKLVVINKLFATNEENSRLYKLCPILQQFKTYELAEIRSSLPVEETWIGLDIEDSEKASAYEYYSKYIETSINIFGSIENVQKARCGNSQLNISAMQICSQIAAENGWNEHLDMSSSYNRQIDELYNPNALNERASTTFEYIRSRSIIATDYIGKLDKILEIVKENKGKKILIINKRGDFAKQVTDYLNTFSEIDICGDYHDRVENVPAIDVYGNPIFYKSGTKKGERRLMGYQMQKTLNETRFKLGQIDVLSTNASPDKDLAITVDIVIITSPLCEDIKSYIYRLSNVSFTDNKIKLYSLFCKNTIEEKELRNKENGENHVILNKCEYEAMTENNFSFVVGD